MEHISGSQNFLDKLEALQDNSKKENFTQLIEIARGRLTNIRKRYIYKDLIKASKWETTEVLSPLTKIIKRQSNIYRNGMIYPCCIMKADEPLFQKSKGVYTVMVMYSTEPYFLTHINELYELSIDALRLQEKENLDSEESEVVSYLNSYYTHRLHYQIPYALADGYHVYITRTLIDSNHLVENKIDRRYYLLLVEGFDIPRGIILPKWYWE